MTAKTTDAHYMHPIQVAANRTGLSVDVLRVWERRYGAVSPTRSLSNRRLYSDLDIERLNLIRRAIEGGRSIGNVAGFSNEELREMVLKDKKSAAKAPPDAGPREIPSGQSELTASYSAECLEAVRNLDRDRLEAALNRASLVFARPVLIEQLLFPLLHKMGDLWSTGSLRIVHEHSASIVLRNFIGGMLAAPGAPHTAPALVAATPAGQSHEFGAMAASVMAIYDGWRVTYIGAELPAEEIAAAVEYRAARALALSIVYPPDDARLIRQLQELKRLVPPSVPIVVGGKAAEAYRRVLVEIGAKIVHSMGEFRHQLQLLRG